MALGTHAQGFIGIAFETTWGTWVAPTRFFPIKSESLTYQQDTQKRRLIRGIADNSGHVAGFSYVSGDIEMELLEDVLPYFLHVSRNTVVKSGTGPWTYTCTPAHWGAQDQLPATKKGMSIAVVKNGITFGYVGCVVSGITISQDGGIPTMKISVVGKNEATQTLPVYSGISTDAPFNTGQYAIEVPTASAVLDCENFEFSVNDSAEPQHRLSTDLTPQWIKWGQREVMLQMERDFNTRTEWDAFKALTSSSVTVKMTKSASASVAIKLANAVRDSHEIDGLSDQGSATKQRMTWEGDYDTATSKSYEIIVVSNVTNIT